MHGLGFGCLQGRGGRELRFSIPNYYLQSKIVLHSDIRHSVLLTIARIRKYAVSRLNVPGISSCLQIFFRYAWL